MPSTPAVRAPRLLRTRVQATARTAGSTTRLNRSSNRRAGSLPAHWCSLVWILSTRARAAAASNSGAPVFTGGLLTFQFLHCELAAALGHVTGFPGLGLLRRLRPTTRRSADGAPSPPRPGRSGSGTAPRWFPRSPLDRSTGSAAQLFPGGLATTTPQHFIVAFDPANPGPGRSSLGDCTSRPRCAPLTGPDPPDSSRRSTFGGSTTGSCTRTPVRLACQARAVWQDRPVLSLSGLLPPGPAPPEPGCSQLHQAAATARRGRTPTSLRSCGASWRTGLVDQICRQTSLGKAVNARASARAASRCSATGQLVGQAGLPQLVGRFRLDR